MRRTLSFQSGCIHSLHRLSTPKHFPFKPHLPHPHMALSALLNKQVTEPLTTTTLETVLTVSCGIMSCFLKSAAICHSLPTLGPEATRLPRKASLLHFSSLMDKTNCNTFLPISRWSNFSQFLWHAAEALTVCYVTRGVITWSKIVLHPGKMFHNTGMSGHTGNWHFGKMLAAKQFVHMINLFWFAAIFPSIHPWRQFCWNSRANAHVLP